MEGPNGDASGAYTRLYSELPGAAEPLDTCDNRDEAGVEGSSKGPDGISLMSEAAYDASCASVIEATSAVGVEGGASCPAIASMILVVL